MIRIETPRGKIITTKSGTVRLVWNAGFQPKWQGRMEDVQSYVDSEVLRYSAPYTPFQVGTLIKSGTLGTEIGSGTVSYIAPYSRYLYYGEVYGPNIPLGDNGFYSPIAPKQPTGRKLQFAGAPRRGAFWFERMKADHKDDILAGARKIAGGRKA
nr:minor capsid protein [uncultured Agathobaculum sp.]